MAAGADLRLLLLPEEAEIPVPAQGIPQPQFTAAGQAPLALTISSAGRALLLLDSYGQRVAA